MMKFLRCAAAAAMTLTVSAATTSADSLACTLTGYKAAPGLTAAVADNLLTLTWDGNRTQEVRLRLAVDGGTPMVRELAIHLPRVRDVAPRARREILGNWRIL